MHNVNVGSSCSHFDQLSTACRLLMCGILKATRTSTHSLNGDCQRAACAWRAPDCGNNMLQSSQVSHHGSTCSIACRQSTIMLQHNYLSNHEFTICSFQIPHVQVQTQKICCQKTFLRRVRYFCPPCSPRAQ